jgi:hypothetical protein
LSPAHISYYVGLADDEDDDDLEKHVASLKIHENASSVEDGLVTLARLQRRLSRQKENVANEMLFHVQLSVELQASNYYF